MVLKDLTKELDSVVFDKKIDTGKLLLTKALLSFFVFVLFPGLKEQLQTLE